MENISRNDIMHVVYYGAGLTVHCTLMSSIWLKHAERERAREQKTVRGRETHTESEGSDFYKHTTPPPLHVQGVTCFSGLPKKTKTILFWLHTQTQARPQIHTHAGKKRNLCMLEIQSQTNWAVCHLPFKDFRESPPVRKLKHQVVIKL